MLTPQVANNIRPFQSLAIGERFTVNPGTTLETQRTFEKCDPVRATNKIHRWAAANACDVASGAMVHFDNTHMITVVSKYAERT